jgi:hypothetical protein
LIDSRDTGGVEREHVDFCSKLLQLLFVFDAEAVLLVDDDQAESRELHAGLKQAMRADHDVGLAGLQACHHLVYFLGGAEAGERLHAHRPVGEAIGECLIMLLRQQRGGYEHNDLLTRLRRDERGTQRHFGFAETHVAAHYSVHRTTAAEVFDHGVDGLSLVRCFFELECGFEGAQIVFRRD